MAALDPALLVEILDRPLDDAPRLVLADALQERGDPRGQFIVTQCRLEQRGLPRWDRATLKREAEALLGANKASWTASAVRLTCTMRRGFIDDVTASASALVSVSPALFAMEPITRLTITDASAEHITSLASTGAFARVLRLTIRGQMKDAGARALAKALAGRKTPLASLNVGGNAIEADGAAALAEGLTGCRALFLTSNAIADPGLAALAKTKALASLETLFLTDNMLTDEGLLAFAKSNNLAALSRLGVARNEEVTQEGLAAIAASKKLRRLRWLEYSDEDEGYQTIAKRGR